METDGAEVHHFSSYDFKVLFKVKRVQLVRTVSTQMLIGVSIKMELGVVKSATYAVLK